VLLEVVSKHSELLIHGRLAAYLNIYSFVSLMEAARAQIVEQYYIERCRERIHQNFVSISSPGSWIDEGVKASLCNSGRHIQLILPQLILWMESRGHSAL
jgi:hypothetical protein